MLDPRRLRLTYGRPVVPGDSLRDLAVRAEEVGLTKGKRPSLHGTASSGSV